MKLMDEFEVDDNVGCVWSLEEIKDEKSCMELAFKIARLWEGSGFYFRGYSDMDTHGNEASFDTEEEVKKASDILKKIDPDDVTVSAFLPEGDIEAKIWLPAKYDKGTKVSLYGPEVLVEQVSSEIKKMVGA